MVQAIIDVEERTNRILNIVKARFGLRDKSEAIDMMAKQYEEGILEPELRPEYVKKAMRIHEQPSIFVGDMKNLRKRYEK